MTIATMADRTLPLKTRVRGLATVTDSDAGSTGFLPAMDALLEDIAAADRLARACLPYERGDDEADDQKAYEDNCDEWEKALDAYRARMQEVARGE